jgi:hypothetical protein
MEYKFFRGKKHDRNIIWRNAQGRDLPLFFMTKNHIINCLNCIAGVGGQTIPNPYLGKTHEEWIEAFTIELNLRESEE